MSGEKQQVLMLLSYRGHSVDWKHGWMHISFPRKQNTKKCFNSNNMTVIITLVGYHEQLL